jgi:hypothetical protein
MEIPVQVVSSYVEVSCPFINLVCVSAASQAVLLNTYLASSLKIVTNTDTSSSLLFYLVRLFSEKHLVLLCLPAFFADGYTLIQMTAELSRIYASCLKGVDLTDEPLQYTDVSDWQDEVLASEEGVTQRQYWRKIDLSQLANTRLLFEQEDPGKLLFSLHQRSYCIEPFFLKLTVSHIAKRLHFELHYDPQRVRMTYVHRLATFLCNLLESVLAQPQMLLGQFPLLTSESF